MSSRMNALLDGQAGERGAAGRRRNLRNPRMLAALLLTTLVGVCFWQAVLYLEHHAKANPLVIMAFPLLAVGTFLTVLPLIFFMSFEGEFRDINPLRPRDYLFLARKTAQALAQNNWKVSAKEI